MSYRSELIQVAASALAAAQVDDVDTTALDPLSPEGCAGRHAFERLLLEVRKERYLQEIKWGTRHSREAPPEFWLAVIGEEIGEVAEEAVQNHILTGFLQAVVLLGKRARAILEG